MDSESDLPELGVWGRAIYYGELFGFVVAWALGALVALEHRNFAVKSAEPADMAQVAPSSR